MVYVVLAVWLVQTCGGLVLLLGWWRHGRHSAPTVLGHVALVSVALALWVTFMVAGPVGWGWAAFAVVTLGNVLGDLLLVGRSRAAGRRSGRFGKDYGAAVGAVLRGAAPAAVTFHALFAGVVYFCCLAACLQHSLG